MRSSRRSEARRSRRSSPVSKAGPPGSNPLITPRLAFSSPRSIKGAWGLPPGKKPSWSISRAISIGVPTTRCTAWATQSAASRQSWNTRDPAQVALAYSADSVWRNRTEFLVGREAIVAFLTRKWNRELDYRLIKEIWAFRENRIAVRFAYEWHDDSFNWFRSYGNENWEFNVNGLMQRRIASINDLPIAAKDRKYHWPLGPRPGDHPSLSDLDL